MPVLRSNYALIAAVIAAVMVAGCDSPVGDFPPNTVYSLVVAKSRSVPTGNAAADATRVVDDLFGTPDDPKWPIKLIREVTAETVAVGVSFTAADVEQLVRVERLQRASGAVASDRKDSHTGLYREHCVACHGIAGSGAGPTSRFQSPYPRDFRHGIYKWKVTERAAKPTRDDLTTLIRRGVVGTAMPSFKRLQQDDVDALVDYVIFLSIRGEVERRLIAAATDDLGYDEMDFSSPTKDDAQWRLFLGDEVAKPQTEAGDVLRGVLQRVVSGWLKADNRITDVPTEQTIGSLSDSIERGKGIFHGQVANCSGCHGTAGSGQAMVLDFDDWSKEYSTRLGITPTNRDAMRPMRDAGALPPRQAEPRNLQSGAFRGGGDPAAIYRVITQGIAGTPMPGLEVSEAGSTRGLSHSEAWDLVHYVLSLSKASRSEPSSEVSAGRPDSSGDNDE